MKRTLFNLLFLAICGMATAQTLSVDDVQVLPGTTASYEIRVNVDGGSYSGFQYQMQFPATGFTLTGTTTVLSTWQGGSLSVGDLNAEGKANASAFSSADKEIPAGDIVIGTVEFEVDEDVELGEYTVTISGFDFLDGTNYIHANDGADLTFKVKVVDKLVLTFNENSTLLPIYTANEKANVKMIRTITAGHWSTIVLPFTLSKSKAETIFGNDVQLAEFAGFNTEYADEEDITPDAITVNFSSYTMTNKKGMTGGKPFLIKTSKDINSFEAEDVTLFSTVTDVEKSDEYDTRGMFTGSFVKSVVPADGLFISDNKFWYSTGITEIKAFRCWLELGAVLDKETDFETRAVDFIIDGETTKIADFSNNVKEDGAIYNLSGQRLNRTQKGINILNGKKILK